MFVGQTVIQGCASAPMVGRGWGIVSELIVLAKANSVVHPH
jgi:hypothetical protein